VWWWNINGRMNNISYMIKISPPGEENILQASAIFITIKKNNKKI
jgi:hypothetical protein